MNPKWDVLQTWIITAYACTYIASVTDFSKVLCYHQVLFAAVTKLQEFEEKN